ncbi:MAG: LptF/LptG family permease [bacterium]|nr:LptF/LptG family permease [bacterium]
MKILQRYVLHELFFPFLFGIAIFTFIFTMDIILQLNDLYFTKKVEIGLIFRLFVYHLPATFAITIPMAVLLSNLISFSRLKQENEITAMLGSGINLNPLIFTIVIASLLLSGGMAIFNNTILPAANHLFKKGYNRIPNLFLNEQKFIGDGNRVFFIDRLRKRGNNLWQGKGIYIYEKEGNKNIFAKQAIFNFDRALLTLEDGVTHQMEGKSYRTLNFERQEIKLDLGDSGREATRGLSEMTGGELKKRIKEWKGTKGAPNFLLIELHKRSSIAFSCVAFTLIGIPIGLLTKKGKGVGFGISVLLIFIYYLLYIIGETLGRRGTIHPILSMWMPNMIVGGIGVFLIAKTIRR